MLAVLGAGLWGALFLAYLPHTGAVVRYGSALLWAALGGAALWGLRHPREYRVLPLLFAVGCAGMAVHRRGLEQELGIPVIDPTQAAVAMAIGIVAVA